MQFTKIVNRIDKNQAHFRENEISYFKLQLLNFFTRFTPLSAGIMFHLPSHLCHSLIIVFYNPTFILENLRYHMNCFQFSLSLFLSFLLLSSMADLINSHIFLWPCIFATWRGVILKLSRGSKFWILLESILLIINKQTWRWPYSAAIWKGVAPYLFVGSFFLTFSSINW